MRNNRGFTLIEIIVTLGISMVMIMAIYEGINSAQKSSAGLERRIAAQQDEKAALELMSTEIRMASYNQLFIADTVLWVATCTGALTPAYKGIQEATANSITIEMDIAGAIDPVTNEVIGNGTIGDPNEFIRYNYDIANQYITRQTDCNTGAQPFLGAAGGASTVVKTVNVVNNALGIPVFRYFDGTGAQIAAPVTASIPDIRRIEITLAVETENIDPNTRSRKRIIYTTSVIPRNHAPALFLY